MSRFGSFFQRLGRHPGVLETARLQLVAITPELVGAEASSHDALARSLRAQVPAAWPPEHWEPHVRTFIVAQYRETPQSAGWHRYVLLKGSHGGTLIGCAGAFPKQPGTVELGYSVLPAYQRRGYATEAVRALIEFLWRTPDVQTVTAQTLLTLPESITVMQRCGLMHAGPGDDPGTIRYSRLR